MNVALTASLLFGVMFYMSCVLGTNVLIALNKLIDSKSVDGAMLLPPPPAGPASPYAQDATAPHCTPTPARALVPPWDFRVGLEHLTSEGLITVRWPCISHPPQTLPSAPTTLR